VASEEHLKILQQGVAVWNDWREKNPEVVHPDLGDADLRKANLHRADLHEADLSGAWLYDANLSYADLSGANLMDAVLMGADLSRAHLIRALLDGAHLNAANFSNADLSGAILRGAVLYETILRGADLSGANLDGAQLILTDLCNTTLTGSRVYGASVWDIRVNDRTSQQNLVITPLAEPVIEPVITVDNIEVAQFVYLLLNNQKLRDVIDTITSKAVLILGRFSEERKRVLGAIRAELRERNYLPIMFDFQASANKTTVGTIRTLANMARFVIADLTDARSVLQELQAIVPDLPKLAVRLLIQKSAHEYGMLDDIRAYRSVVEETYEYESLEEVIASIKKNIIGPAEAKVKELRQTK